MRARRPIVTLALVLGGVFLGLVLGEVLRGGEEPRTADDTGAAARAAPLGRESDRLRTDPKGAELDGAARPPTAPRREAELPEPGAPPAPTHGEAEVGVSQRAAPSAQATPIPASLPVLDVIRRLLAEDRRQEDTHLVSEGFAPRFEPATHGPTLRGDEIAADGPLEDGTTIVLDDGVYDFSAFAAAHRGAFPADVTFRGIGRDRTLLLLHEVGATGEMRNLAFEDLTLDTRGHYLADVRGDDSISLRFERARVVGFDASPGGAVLLAARHGAVLARDTLFEAGFGNAPGTGSLFHVRGPFLVRFERCVIRGPFRSLYEKSPRAAYVYADCRFEQMAPERRRDLETTDPSVRFEDCAIDYATSDAASTRPRSIQEINDDWK